jgi:hypothetical protein
VLCGSESIDWQTLVSVQTKLREPVFATGAMTHLVTPGHNLGFWIGGWGPYALYPTYPSDGLGTSSPDLFTMLQKHASKLASDPRDKIYALVGMSKQRSNFPINYSSSVRDVYTNLAQTVIAESQSLDIIYVVMKDKPLNEHGFLLGFQIGVAKRTASNFLLLSTCNGIR